MSDRQKHSTTQRLELSDIAEEEITHTMGWNKLPTQTKVVLKYWFTRFFELGTAFERDKTIEQQLRADTAESKIQTLERANEKLRDYLLNEGVSLDARQEKEE